MVNSLILNNLKKFRSSALENTSYKDIRFDGIQNNTIEINDGDALVQNFKIWLLSGTYDYWRSSEKGGVLVKHLIKKPMTEENCKNAEALIKADANSIFPNIIVEELKVSMDLARRRWLVRICVIDRKTGLIGTSDSEVNPELYGNVTND